MTTPGDPRLPAIATASGDLVTAARERVTRECALLPAWDSPAFWAAIRGARSGSFPAFGALVHCIRRAAQSGDLNAARELFVVLLHRLETPCGVWAARVVAGTPAARERGAEVREELRQELTLYLWEQLAGSASEKWELFFQRALDYAQRHTATAYMVRRGYWSPKSVRRPRRGYVRLMESLASIEDGETVSATSPADAASALSFTIAELADLRALVTRLPFRERAVIVMRFWQGATEAEMGSALGVSTRTVRSDLQSAYRRLREWYEGYAAHDGQEQANA